MPAVLEVVVLGGLLPSIPEGENYLWHTNRGGGLQLFGWRTRYWSFLLKLAKSLPSWTIQAQPASAIGPFHWRSRKLTTREMCRLQTPTAQLVEAAKRAADWLPGFASALHRDARPLGEPDAHRGSRTAPASPPGRRAPRVARSARGAVLERNREGRTA